MRRREHRFLSCMYVLSLACLLGLAVHGLHSSVAVSAEGWTAPLVILDAGHGGPDGGTSAADGTEESGINLEIARRTDAVLGLLGQRTLMTRDTAGDLSDPEANTISEKKVSDIRNRVELVNSHPDSVLVSIHQNAYPEDVTCRGPQVFYTAVGTSRSLAEALQDALAALPDGKRREIKAISRDVYLMNHIRVPGVLVECGFLSNPGEAAMLESPEYQKKLAVAIAAAVAGYLTEDNSGV